MEFESFTVQVQRFNFPFVLDKLTAEDFWGTIGDHFLGFEFTVGGFEPPNSVSDSSNYQNLKFTAENDRPEQKSLAFRSWLGWALLI